MKKFALTVLPIAALTICSASCLAKEYEATWESLDGYPVPQWFDEARFGIFIHWGGYSELGYKKNDRGYAEHTPKHIYEDPEHYYPVLKQN